MSKGKHRGISRVNYTRSPGWLGRISLNGNIVRQKHFPDKKLGGKKLALQAANTWRNEWYDVLAIREEDYNARPRRLYLEKSPRPNRTSGRVGVFCYWKKGSGDSVNGYFIAHYTPIRGQRRKEKSFSIARHGYERALEQACRQRESWEQELDKKA